MRNVLKAFGIIALVAVIGFSMAACGGGDDGGGGGGGKFNVTGIPAEYNGKHAWIPSFSVSSSDFYIGGDKYGGYSGFVDKNSRISNGKVSIPIWTIRGERYSGNDTTELRMIICENDTDTYFGTLYTLIFDSVTFSNGNATKSWNDGHSTADNTGGNPQTAAYTGASGGTTYTLTITENTARYTAQNGDAYELTAGAKTSAGTVSNVSGNTLTLKPSNTTTTFTATVSGTSLTALNGTIRWNDNTTATAPGALTGGNTGGGNMTWTAATDSKLGTETIVAIAYGNNTFVAGSYDGKIAYSTDNGKTWTAVADSKLWDIDAIAFGNGKFVAGGGYGEMATSTDGVTWNAVAKVPFKLYFYAIAYGDGKFVAVGANDYYGSQFATSADGVTWTAVPNTKLNSTIRSITFGNGKFVAVGSTSTVGVNTEKIAYSTDGTNWKTVADSKFGEETTIWSIAFGNGKFVAVGDDSKIATSTDGSTWTAVTTDVFTTTDIFGIVTFPGSIEAIAFGGGKFVAGSANGRMAYSSDNGVTWNAVTTTAFDYVLYGSTYTAGISAIAYGNGTFVAGSDGSKIAYSTGN